MKKIFVIIVIVVLFFSACGEDKIDFTLTVSNYNSDYEIISFRIGGDEYLINPDVIYPYSAYTGADSVVLSGSLEKGTYTIQYTMHYPYSGTPPYGEYVTRTDSIEITSNRNYSYSIN